MRIVCRARNVISATTIRLQTERAERVQIRFRALLSALRRRRKVASVSSSRRP